MRPTTLITPTADEPTTDDTPTPAERAGRAPVRPDRRRADGFGADDRAVSEVLGTILMFAVLLALLVLIQATAVPGWNQQVEYEHNQRAQTDLAGLTDALDRAASVGASETVAVEMGARYPPRPFLFNPPPATGYLDTVDREAIVVSNARALDPEASDYWDGSDRPFATKALVYRTEYNQYRNAPRTTYEHGTLFNEWPNGQATLVSGGSFVNGNQVSLVALSGNVSRAGVSAEGVDVGPVDAPSRRVSLTNDTAAPLNVTVRTTMTEAQWTDALADQRVSAGGNVQAITYTEVADAPNRLTVSLRPGVTYDVRVSRLRVGASPTASGPAYLTRVEGGNGTVATGTEETLTVEVRGPHNEPKSGVPVTFTTSDGTFANGASTVTVTSDQEGHASAAFSAATTGGVTAVATIPTGASEDARRVGFTMNSIPVGTGGGDAAGGGLNPSDTNGAVVLVDSSYGGSTATLKFTKFGGSTTRSISDIRVNVYYAIPQGAVGNQRDAPTQASVTASRPGFSTGPVSLDVGGSFDSFSPDAPVENDAGSASWTTVRLAFSGGGFNGIKGGDFFTVTLLFDDGGAAQYFVVFG